MDQLLLAGQPCSEAEWNLTQNGLQWKVNNKRKWTYDSGRSINLPSPECQNKRESRRSWVHLGKNFILPKEQAAYWKEAASPEWSKGGKRSKKMLRVSWTIHSLFSSREGITSTFSTTDPQSWDLPATPFPRILAGLYHQSQSWPWTWYNPETQRGPGAKCLKTTAKHPLYTPGHRMSSQVSVGSFALRLLELAKGWPGT